MLMAGILPVYADDSQFYQQAYRKRRQQSLYQRRKAHYKRATQSCHNRYNWQLWQNLHKILSQ